MHQPSRGIRVVRVIFPWISPLLPLEEKRRRTSAQEKLFRLRSWISDTETAKATIGPRRSGPVAISCTPWARIPKTARPTTAVSRADGKLEQFGGKS